jgi:hypothetical protein
MAPFFFFFLFAVQRAHETELRNRATHKISARRRKALVQVDLSWVTLHVMSTIRPRAHHGFVAGRNPWTRGRGQDRGSSRT